MKKNALDQSFIITPVYGTNDDETVNAFYALLDDKNMSNEEKARKLMGM